MTQTRPAEGIAGGRGPWSGHLAMLLFSFLVSWSFSVGHLVADEIDPAVLTALRFAIALPVMFAVLLVRSDSLVPVFSGFWRWAVIGALMGLYFITMFEALRLTTAVSTAAVFTLTPLLAAGFGWVLIRQRTSAWVWNALGIGALGALWVIFRADLGALLRFDLGPGEAIFMIGAVGHAFVPGLLRRWTRGETPVQTSCATILGALMTTTLYAFPDLRQTDFSAVRPFVYGVAVYLGIVTTAVTFFLLQYASLRLPPAKVMAYTYLVPSWVVLWESLGGKPVPSLILIGIAATLVALLMLLRLPDDHRP